MMRLAVSQRVEEFPERNERRDALDQRLVQWLASAGALSYPVPNAWSDGNDGQPLSAWLIALEPTGIVLSGGEDLHASPARDATERALLRYAQAHRLPVLGLCRGMQMLAAFSGGILVKIPGHAGSRHALDTAEGSELPSAVNSFHAWGLLECPAGYEILARAADGSIEAIRHSTLPWEGWMWHPEREPTFAESGLVRLQSLLFDPGSGGGRRVG